MASVALLVLASVPLPDVSAGPNDPTDLAWSPYSAPVAIHAVGLAKNGSTFALALGDVSTLVPPVVGLPQANPPATDLVVFDAAQGRLFNSSEVPQGKSAVGVSGDGKVVVAGSAFGTTFAVSEFRVSGPAAPIVAGGPPGAQGASWTDSRDVHGVPTSIAVTRTGDLAAVGVASSPTEGHTLVFSSEGTAVFDHLNPGRIRAVAISSDGQWVVSGGRYVDDGGKGTARGVVYLFHGSSSPVYTFKGADENLSEVSDVAIAPDGSGFVATTVGGQLLDFRAAPAPQYAAAPYVSAVSLKNPVAAAVALSDDGAIAVNAVGKTLFAWHRDPAGLRPLWNATLAGDINSIDADAHGDLILAADGGAAQAFSSTSNVPYWSLPGAATNASVSSNGTYAAFAQAGKLVAAKLPRKISFLFETSPGVGVPTSPGGSAPPHGSITFRAVLRNDGALPDRGAFEIPSARQFSVVANATSYALLPGAYREISLTVSVGDSSPGHYLLNVTAHSLVDPRYRTNITIGFDVLAATDVSATLIGATERIIAQNGNDSLLIDVANRGNDRAQVTLDLAQHPSNGSLWTVRLVGDRVFTVPGASHATARVIVTAPRGAFNGTTNLIDASVRSTSGVTDLTVLYRINPVVGVNFTGPRTLAKFVQPGQFVQYNLTVINTGSITTDFAATWEATPSNGKNWVVDLDTSPFTLAAGQNHTFPVRVFAPGDATAGDRDTVKVEVKSVPSPGIKLNSARENQTLVANAVAPLPTPPRATPSVVPGFAPVTALAAVAVAHLVRRRRA